jgi:hypothetical protein
MARIERQTVESVSTNGKSINVNGAWFSAFSAAMIGPVSVGDTVTFNFKEGSLNPKTGNPYLNIVGKVENHSATAMPTAPYPTPSTRTPVREEPITDIGKPALHNSRLILRQNAGTTAAAILAAYTQYVSVSLTQGHIVLDFNMFLERWKEAAKFVEDHTSGDADFEAATKALGD